MLTPEQLLNNLELDRRIREADEEFELYLMECEAKRKKFYEENPNHWFKSMHIPVRGKRFVGGIRYIDTP